MWLSRAEYDRLVLQVESAQEALALERAENRRAERHWANMFMRRLQTFPLASTDQSVTTPVTNDFTPPPPEIDPGELEAMIAVGADMGVSKDEVERLLRMERGLPV